jgi:uncharacterized membrane protein YfcA
MALATLALLSGGGALPTKEAVPLSLLVVMLLALGNLGPYLRRGHFALRPALILGLPALTGSWIGGSWVKAGYVPEPVQLGMFAAAALLASWLLTRRRGGSSVEALKRHQALQDPATGGTSQTRGALSCHQPG